MSRRKFKLFVAMGTLAGLVVVIVLGMVLLNWRPTGANEVKKSGATTTPATTASGQGRCNNGAEICPAGHKQEKPTPTATHKATATPVVPITHQSIVSVTQPLTFPMDLGMADVKAKYGAKGDGVTDDTAAIQKALSDGRDKDQDYYGRPKALYFPAGTYIVNDTLTWRGCCVTLQGQGSGVSIIKLRDGAAGFGDTAHPKAVILTPEGNMSFRQNIWNLGINTGSNNPGAIGLDYISNNVGSLTEVTITSGDGQGHSGLEMTRAWPGPCLIAHLIVSGFDYGIMLKQGEYGPTFEHIALNYQRVAGFSNENNIAAIRNLQSDNRVPVIQNSQTGSIILLDAQLLGGVGNTSAISNAGFLYARNITSTGYQAAISNNGSVVPGNKQDEYVSGQSYGKFANRQASLKLPVEETPDFVDGDLNNWAKFSPRWYGDVDPLQATLDSGKSTIYFPFGTYLVGKVTVTVPATVRRIIGFSSAVNTWADGGSLTFKVVGESSQPLIIEQFAYGVSVEHASGRTVVMKDGSYGYTDTAASGKLFLADTGGSITVTHPHSVWARQLNSEGSDHTQIVNKGGTVWILGIKTEGRASVIETSDNGKTELLGTLIYPAQAFPAAEQDRAAFVSTNASVSFIYGGSSYVNDGFYKVLVVETRNGETRKLLASEVTGRTILYSGF